MFVKHASEFDYKSLLWIIQFVRWLAASFQRFWLKLTANAQQKSVYNFVYLFVNLNSAKWIEVNDSNNVCTQLWGNESAYNIRWMLLTFWNIWCLKMSNATQYMNGNKLCLDIMSSVLCCLAVDVLRRWWAIFYRAVRWKQN